jgi:adenosylcobinamide-GDP ribazoletransferase
LITDFLTAVRFLTVLPLGRGKVAEPGRMASAMAYFPLVGTLIGLALASVDYLLSGLLPRQVLDVILIGLLALVAGGLHLDGLADSVDGIIGGRGDKARTLEIMKDSRIGAMGVVGLTLLLLLKYAALEGLTGHLRTGALIVMPTLGRWSQVQMSFRSKAARSEGSLAQPFTELLRLRHFLIATAVSIAVASYAGLRGALAFGLVLIFSLAARAYFHRSLGGVTGDTIGGVSELSEALVLLVFVFGV